VVRKNKSIQKAYVLNVTRKNWPGKEQGLARFAVVKNRLIEKAIVVLAVNV
jgi:hypothetical protein